VIRSLFAALAAVALGLSAANADELKGTLKSVDAGAKKLTVTVDGKDQTLPVSKDASFVSVSTTKGKKGKTNEQVTNIDGGLGALKAGANVTLLTEKTDDKETVTSVKVTAGESGKKAKKAKKAKKPTAATQLISTAEKKADKAKGKAAKKGDKKKNKKADKKKNKKGKKAKKSKKSKTA
jgi:Cu/Ag efflux protein CusF